MSSTAPDQPVVEVSFLIVFNAHPEPVDFTLPPPRFGRRWEVTLSAADLNAELKTHAFRPVVTVESRSLLVLQRV
jgi:isoamylase